jgi:hypothetical protein
MPNSFQRSGFLAIGALAVALTLGACGGSSNGAGVANSGTGKASTAVNRSDGGSMKADALKYSQCMRSHGVTNFPDPNAQGQIWLGNPGSGNQIDPSSAQFQAAQEACKNLVPGGSPQQQSRDRTTALKYSLCMRSHGVTNFPDPTADGGIKTDNNQMDPNTPAYKAAEKACVAFQPGGPNAPRGQFGQGPGGGA